MTSARARFATTAGIAALLFAAFTVQAPAAGATGNADPGPPGNNGTVKLDGLDLFDGPGHSGAPNDPDETEPDNDPHLTCRFQLEFFDFDTGQLADIVFTAHPPTGDGGVLLAQHQVGISDDGTGGAANDPDATFDYDVLADFDTTRFTSSHDAHGWHVKLDLTVYDAAGTKVPGGQKHKVFWVEGCQPVIPEEPTLVCPDGMVPPEDEDLADGDGDDLADNCVTPQQPEVEVPVDASVPVTPVVPTAPDTPDTPEVPDVVDEAPGEVLPEVLVPDQPAATPNATEVLPAPAPAVDDARVLGASVSQPATAAVQSLPRTGTDATTDLALAGLGMVVTGAALTRRSGRTARA